MIRFIEQKIREELYPLESKELWVARKVLRIPETLVQENMGDLCQLIYRAYDSLKFDYENAYIHNYNLARIELVCTMINPPDVVDKRIIPVESEPTDDISYWLATHVLGYTNDELSTIIDDFDPDYITRELIPIIKATWQILYKIRFDDKIMQEYHRRRHLLLRYMLDAVYHEL